uniref:Uncharacterized protein n=1 Tax=Cacopsylla melanoneura TaxID=428564 RepID=A0A8D8TUN5_9HEMI
MASSMFMSALFVFSMLISLNNAGMDWMPYGSPILKEIPNVANLCPGAGCASITIDQARSVCGDRFPVDSPKNPGKGDDNDKSQPPPPKFASFTNLSPAKCNGVTCHVEVETDLPDYHAGMDCTQKGPAAACTCTVYRRVFKD